MTRIFYGQNFSLHYFSLSLVIEAKNFFKKCNEPERILFQTLLWLIVLPSLSKEPLMQRKS